MLPINPPAVPVQSESIAPVFESPVNGKIIAPFSDKNPGIVVETKGKAPVKVAADGEVTQIGRVDDWENVVVVRHVDGSETWYQGLENIKVAPNGKVKKGDQLGDTAEQNGKYLVSIYYYQEQTLKNPTAVIQIEP
jgi:murein DD-endopeptidase MepM/ murein hydrolase activator NlpD